MTTQETNLLNTVVAVFASGAEPETLLKNLYEAVASNPQAVQDLVVLSHKIMADAANIKDQIIHDMDEALAVKKEVDAKAVEVADKTKAVYEKWKDGIEKAVANVKSWIEDKV